MGIKKETFTLKRDKRCIFKGGGVREYSFPVEYTLEECLNGYCLVKGWEWVTLVKTIVKGGYEWGYFTYKVTYQEAWRIKLDAYD